MQGAGTGRRGLDVCRRSGRPRSQICHLVHNKQKTKWLWISSAEGGRKNHESQEDGAVMHIDGSPRNANANATAQARMRRGGYGVGCRKKMWWL